MDNNLIVKDVDLFGDNVIVAKDNEGNIWAGVSYICKGLGLGKNEKDRQIKNIQKDETLKRGCVKFDAGVFDPNNETVALKLEFVPLWLAKITITPSMKENNPILVDKLVKYQLQAKDILAEAFLPTKTNITYQYPLPAATFTGVADLGRLIERVMRSEGACPHEIATVLRPIFQQAGIEVRDCFVKLPAYEQLTLDVVTR